MGPRLRTFMAGLGVVAVCFAIASLKSQYLLLAFALAGICWSLRNWRKLPGKAMRYGELDEPKPVMRRTRRGNRWRSNVYEFPPATGWGTQSISDA